MPADARFVDAAPYDAAPFDPAPSDTTPFSAPAPAAATSPGSASIDDAAATGTQTSPGLAQATGSESPLPTPERLQAVLAEIEAAGRAAGEPSLQQLQRAAVLRSGSDPARSLAWIRRARLAFVLPTMQVSVDHHVDNGWQLDRQAGDPDDLRADVGTAQIYKLRATWELDRVIFNPDELRAARAHLDELDWRRQLLVEVTRLYFERRRLQVESRLVTAKDGEAMIARQLRIAELEGLLSAMTGLVWQNHRETDPRSAF